MSPAAEILVIIVSVVLSIFLIVSIILGVYLIKLSAEIRKIAKTAEQTVSSVGNALSGFARLASPVFVAEMLNKMFKKHTKKK